MPFVPAEHRGQLVVIAMLAYAGAVEDGERAVAPFRSLATPIVDMVRPMAYPEIYPPEEDRDVREAWVATFAAALRQSESAAYVGFLGVEGEARVREAYPGSTWDRLAAVKRHYDPANFFRLNQNIPPATEDTWRT